MLTALAIPQLARADTVRAALGKPLLQAQALIAARHYPAALAKLHAAAAIGRLTPYETFALAALQGEAAGDEGDCAQAAAAYQTALASGAAPAAERPALIQAIAGLYDRAGDTPDAIVWVKRYIAAGGQDSATRALLPQLYFQAGDDRNAEQAEQAEIARARAAGRRPAAAQWQLLAAAAQKSGDSSVYQSALDGILATDPSPAYWASAIGELLARPGFPDGLRLDVYRLRRATGTLSAPADYEDYAERAILAGQPAEAKAVIAEGFARQILNAQTDAGHAARLRSLLAAGPPAPPGAPPANQLDAAIAAFQAGDAGTALAEFNRLAGPPGTAPAARLARLWAIRAGAG